MLIPTVVGEGERVEGVGIQPDGGHEFSLSFCSLHGGDLTGGWEGVTISSEA